MGLMKPPVVDGPAVRRLRAERHWTRAELSEKSGISVRHLGRIENGIAGTQHAVTAQKIAEALEVPVEDLHAVAQANVA